MRAGTIATAVIGACLAVPASASAAQIVAGPAPVTYQNPNITISAGEEVSFLNLDLTAPHDVTSIEIGQGAAPLFSSATVGFPTEVPVTGVSKLGGGTYDYICSIHTFMTGTITVTGGGSGAPKLSLRARDRRLADVADAGALRVRAKVSERAIVRVVAKAGKTKVATGRKQLEKGSGTVKAKLTSKGKRLAAKRDRLALKVTARATDVDGDTDKISFKLKLR